MKPMGVAAPADGFAYMTGWFDDDLVVDGTTLTSKGADDMMVLRIAPPPTPGQPSPPPDGPERTV